MKTMDLAKMRLASQHIAGTRLKTVKAVVGWMGAMQAQDYAMAKWAIGVRLPGTTDKAVEAVISDGEVIRMHLLRPTWHIVSADDVHWLLALTAPRIKASLQSRHRELGLSAGIIAKSNALIERRLRDGAHATREEIVAGLGRAGIATDGNRASHLLLRAELDGIVCSGAIKGNRQTYALLAERVPRTGPLSREEALARLASRYFASHGPATLQDFTWWSGLSAGEAKRSLAMVQADFISETIASQTYWFTRFGRLPRASSARTFRAGGTAVHLLPAFDEFIIGYKDRSAALSSENHGKAVSSNGLFRPVIMTGGQIIGTWKRAAYRNGMAVETALFMRADPNMKNALAKASARLGDFLGRKIDVISLSRRSVDWE